MGYALDRLGWLQFEQLCTRVAELDGGVPSGAWSGGADRCRFALSQAAIGPPLSSHQLSDPVLLQCAWISPDAGEESVRSAVEQLAAQCPDELAQAGSFLLMANAEFEKPLPTVLDNWQLGLLGTHELGARIDASAELRLAMPSLLGLDGSAELTAPAVASGSTIERTAANQLAEVFVPTRAYAKALQVLTAHRFAVLTGPPEMGKTAIARMIALAQMTCGWQAHECTSPEAVWRAFDPACSQVFIADDAFGSTEYRADAADRWALAIERLLRSMDQRHWLIWTSRPAPLHAALRRLHRERGAERFPAPANVLVDASDLDVIEKTLILFRHAKHAALAGEVNRKLQLWGEEIVANRHFTPERIRRLVAHLQIDPGNVMSAVSSELNRATDAMAASFDTLGADHQDLLIALLDTPPGPVSERDLVAALRRHHDGSLSRAPVELVDRLSDHFLRVHT